MFTLTLQRFFFSILYILVIIYKNDSAKNQIMKGGDRGIINIIVQWGVVNRWSRWQIYDEVL